jgi:CHAT domain-containing protein/tetratricopeptide (TPR) repeat protein
MATYGPHVNEVAVNAITQVTGHLRQGDLKRAEMDLGPLLGSDRSPRPNLTPAHAVLAQRMLADIRMRQAKPREAIQLLELALKIDANDPGTLEQLGSVFTEIGQPDRGIEALERALEAVPATDPIQQSSLLRHAGHVHTEIGYPSEALTFYEEAERLLSGQHGEQISTLRASLLSDTAVAWRLLGNSRRARRLNHVSIRLARRSGDLEARSKALHNLGIVHSRATQLWRGGWYLHRALRLRRDRNVGLEALTSHALGVLWARRALRLQQRRLADDWAWRRALAWYGKALARWERADDAAGQRRAAIDIARSMRRSNDPKWPQAFEQAVHLFEESRQRIDAERIRGPYLDSQALFFSEYSALTALHGDPQSALSIIDLVRARMLREHLARDASTAPAAVDHAQAVHALGLARDASAQRGRVPRSSGGELIKAQRALATQEARLSGASNAETHDLEEIQAQLTPNQTLLTYLWTDPHSALICVTARELVVRPIPADDLIDKEVESLRSALEKRANVEARLERLWSWLLEPVAGHLRDELLIVADGALALLPWAALCPTGTMRRAHGDWLFQTHAPALLPSPSLLVAPRTPSARANYGLDLLAFAASLTDVRPANTRTGPRSPTFGALRHVIDEVEAVTQTFGDRAQMYRSATPSQVVEAVNGRSARYLHFACHGVVNEMRPDLSGIVLEGDRAPALLTRAEIMALPATCELVTVSACDTGRGRLVAGEGVMDLASAFLYSGAAAACMSLWGVDDRTAPELMTGFYEALQSGVDHAQALAQAQASQVKRHPYYWAWPSITTTTRTPTYV